MPSSLSGATRLTAAFVFASAMCSCAGGARTYVYASFVQRDAQIRTLAGNGIRGFRDGFAADAEFVDPVAVGYNRKTGGIVVADTGSQRVREVLGSQVLTIAGSEGGYRDGSATRARFREPRGIAIAPDGSIYVADSGNRCIRKIAGGNVSTVVGSPTRRYADGRRVSAGFGGPRGLAFGNDAVLYVADYGAGVRVVSPSGKVTTLPIDPALAKTVSSVAYWNGDGMRALFVTFAGGVFRFNLDSGKVEGEWDTSILPDGIVAVGVHQFVASSPVSHNLTFDDLGTVRRVVAGADVRDRPAGAGYADGTQARSRFFKPEGLSLDSQENIIVADSGNRRIRLVPAINTREFSEGGLGPASMDRRHYRIAYISDSIAFHNAMWDDSIEGTLEDRLNNDRARIGLPRSADVAAIRYPGNLQVQGDYIRNALGQGSVDLVIWSINSNLLRDDRTDWPFTLPGLAPQQLVRWRFILEKTQSDLQENGTQLVVVDQPLGFEAGPLESIDSREHMSQGAPERFREVLREPDFASPFFKKLGGFLSTLPLRYLNGYEAFMRAEQGAHPPLFFTDDWHLAPNGNRFYGNVIADYLEATRPWQSDFSSPLAFGTTPYFPSGRSEFFGPGVFTVAGDGHSGIREGDVRSAEFMLPFSVAYDTRNGALIVADAAAQRIDEILQGQVRSIAGGGGLLPNRLGVRGEFADGAGSKARFHNPMGVAVAADGSIYVADTGNHCIRVIRHGVVTTYSGSPSRPDARDGSASEAAFAAPRSIAVAKDRTLFVADFGFGIREVRADGTVSTLDIPIGPDARSISIWEAGGKRALFIATGARAGRFDLDSHAFRQIDSTPQEPELIWAAGIVPLNYDAAAVSSTMWDSILEVKFDDAKGTVGPFSRVLAGDVFQDAVQAGGFADGQASTSRFYAPVAITVGPANRLIVADAGNRRIRSIPVKNALFAVGP